MSRSHRAPTTEEIGTDGVADSPREQASRSHEIERPVVGKPSTIGSVPWWSANRDWCLLPSRGGSTDILCDAGTVGDAAVLAASLRGDKHKVDGQPNEDSFAIRTSLDPSGRRFLVAVLCDGLSSAAHSSHGARLSADEVAKALARFVAKHAGSILEGLDGILEDGLSAIGGDVLARANDIVRRASDGPHVDLVPSDINATLTFLLVPVDLGDAESVTATVGAIGDSPILVLDTNRGTWSSVPLGLEDRDDDVVSTATRAFPTTTRATVSNVELTRSDVIVAMSDGVSNFVLVRGQQTALAGYLASNWAQPVRPTTFVNDLSFDLASADDDRTAIACWLQR